MRDRRDQTVRNTGEELPDRLVVALLPPAGQQVQVLFQELGHHARHVRRVVLQVSVEGRDDFSPGRVDARLHGRGLAEVALQPDDAHVRTETRRLLAQLLAGREALLTEIYENCKAAMELPPEQVKNEVKPLFNLFKQHEVENKIA